MKRLAIVLTAFLCHCATTSTPDPKDKPKAPEITRDMSLEDALKAGIDFGGDTARNVRKLITKRKEWPLAEKALVDAINEGIIKYENLQLVNAVMLYVAGPVKPSDVLFQKMVNSGRPIARQLGWQMASALPSKAMRTAIEREINRALVEGDEADILLPQMANAVQANRMTSAYTLVRQGLMTNGHEDFAASMAVLDPERASSDFVEYLALCPPEELRQLSVSTVNVYAVTFSLNHMTRYPPAIGHHQIETIFYYAISRNPGLSDLATALIDTLSQRDQRGMAIALSRLPAWTQVAFIENARRNMTPTRRVFLSELKRVSPQQEVSEELGELKL